MATDNKKTKLSPLKRAFMALEDANRRISTLEKKGREPIAIVGIGCRFPGGASNPDRYWELLRDGRDAVTEIPADRWAVSEFYDSNPEAPGKMSVRRGAFIDDVDKFDAEFFGISPREARSMDPQQRLLLEVTWEALEDAAIPPTSLSGSATAVFIGMCKSDYGYMHRSSGDSGRFGIYPVAGGAYSMASGRISYSLGLQGPSATIDTACSSSLVALHLACQGLLQDDCTLAIAGGVNLILSPDNTVSFCKAEMMSPDGRCKTFDADANGFVQGEGCGVVVLKRLSDAMADTDNILAVIRASAVNQDGPSSGLTTPNGAAQQDVIRLALTRAGISPADIDYVEAHGTGTSLGDPIEIRALAEVLGEGHSKDRPLLLGSVKTNMGHLESAAGLASLIKVVLSLKHRTIPPHLHFKNPSPHIEWNKIPLAVVTKPTQWLGDAGPRTAGVSSFGFSGTNVHVIISEAPDEPRPAESKRVTPDVFAISAKNDQALDELISRYRDFLESPETEDLAVLCKEVSTARTHFPARLSICADSIADLREALAGADKMPLPKNVERRMRGRNAEPRVAFLFTGQGSQYIQMGRELYADQPVFRDAMSRCDTILREHFELPLLDILYPKQASAEKARQRLSQTRFAQPALFAFEYALASLWMSWGIRPSAVAGHSVGEYVAACVAGLFELDDALRLVAIRGQLMQDLPAGGKMAAIHAPRDEVDNIISDSRTKVVVAAVNGPRNTVVSGNAEEIDELIALFNDAGVDSQLLQVSHAFHSPQMRAMISDFADALRETKFGKLATSLVSNVSGKSAKTSDVANPDYWLQHIEEPVLFADSIQSLKERGCEIFIEIGPHPVLTTLGQTCLDDEELVWLPSMRRPSEGDGAAEWTRLRRGLAKYYVSGGNVDWQAVFPDICTQHLPLPTYPFQRVRHWFDTADPPVRTLDAQVHPLLGSRIETPLHEALFQLNLAAGRIAFIDDHVVHGRTVLPATAYLEMANAAARASGFGQIEIVDLVLVEALILPESVETPVQIVLDSAEVGWDFRVFSHGSGDAWKLHCEAKLLPAHLSLDEQAVPRQAEYSEQLSVDEYYQSLFDRGLHFGDRLLGISSIERNDGEAIAKIAVPPVLLNELADYGFHPAVLDACIQVIGAAVPGYSSGDSESAIFMPVAIDRCTVRANLSSELISCARVTASGQGGETMTGEVRVWDDGGNCVAHIAGIRMKRVNQADLAVDVTEDCLYQTVWREKSDAPPGGRSLPEISVDDISGPVRTTFDTLASEYDLAEYYRVLPRLENIAARFIQWALLKLGWRPGPGDSVTAESLSHDLGVAPVHARLLNRFLQILSQEGILELDGSEFVVKKKLGTSDPLPDVKKLLDEWAAGQAETELVARCGPALADVLTDKADPLDLLFPHGDTEAAAAIYTRSPLAQVFNATVAEAVDAALQQIPDRQKLRILEIGAGTGGTTRFVMDRIDTRRVEYLFTDLGALFVSRAEERFGNIEAVAYQVLDIERDPIQQGLESGYYDLIIASNVVHATKNLDKTLSHIERLLAPSGLLLMTEVVARQNWIDTTFGMTGGWWHFSDSELRPDYPLLSAARWQSYLKGRGFTNIVAVPAGADRDHMSTILISTAPASASGVSSEPSSPWLIFGDHGSIAEAFLRARGSRSSDQLIVQHTEIAAGAADCIAIQPDRPGDYDEVLKQVDLPTGIVFFWPLDDAEDRLDPGVVQPDSTATSSCKALLLLVQALVKRDVELPGGLWLVTAGAQAIGFDDSSVSVFQAPVWGFAKVIAQEHPELHCRIVDLDPASPGRCAGQLAAVVDHAGDEPEQAFRNSMTFVPRLVRVSSLASFQSDKDRNLRLSISKRGLLENIVYQESTVSAPGCGEVEIRVHTSGLNFRDVLNALGTYAGGDAPFGSECSGIVESIGEGVDEFSVGDRVIAIAEHAFADRVIAKSQLVIHKPENLAWAIAACLPIAYVTAYYCLHTIGALKAKERVLVHAGAGGVGMAAVQLALCAGAEVYATAGSDKKRQFLQDMGVKAALDSRSTDFATELRSATGGDGVDIVINSLADDFIPASLSVLNPRGRFIEIGRSGIWSDEQVAAVRNDIDYHPVDLSSDMLNPTTQMHDTFRSLVALVENGTLGGLPVKTFSRDETTAAFRYMAQAKHIGKVAIEAPRSSQSWLRTTGSYLVTGAFGGLGLLVANWLADKGVTSMTLLGRSQPSQEGEKAIRLLRDRGVAVKIVIGDVSDASTMGDIFDELEQNDIPLRGIMHCAGALSDAPIVQQSWADFEAVFKAKVHGAWLLHRLSRNLDLDFFVSFSSIASVLGSPGQSNHCAANSFLDLLAHYRRAKNLPAVNINWGVWSGVGAAVSNDVEEQAVMKGLSLLAPNDGLQFLELLLRSGRAQTMVQAVDWTTYRKSMNLDGREVPYLSEVGHRRSKLQGDRTRATNRKSLRAELDQLPVENRSQFLIRLVQDEVARVLGLDSAAQLPDDLPLKDAGLDSLMAVELRNAISKRIECKLPATLMFDYPTVLAVSIFLEDLLFGNLVAAPGDESETLDDSTDLDRMFDNIENLSEEEANRLYEQKVREN